MGGCLGLINHPGLALQTNARDVPGLERWALSPRVSAISGSISHPRGCVSVGGQDCYFSFALVCSYTTQWSKGRGLKKLKLHPGWPKRFHVSRSKSRHSGTWGAAGLPPQPSRTAGPGSPQARQRDHSAHRPWGSDAWQRRGRHRRGGSGRHRRGRTWPAALKRRGGPGLGTCGRAAGCCFCEPPLAGRDPAVPSPSSSPASFLTLFPLFSPRFAPPQPWLQDGGAETDHVSDGRVRWAGRRAAGAGPTTEAGLPQATPLQRTVLLALGRFYGIHALSVLVEIQNSINMHYGLNLLGHSSSPHLPHLSLHPFACESGWTTLLKRFIGGWRDSCKGPGFGS